MMKTETLAGQGTEVFVVEIAALTFVCLHRNYFSENLKPQCSSTAKLPPAAQGLLKKTLRATLFTRLHIPRPV